MNNISNLIKKKISDRLRKSSSLYEVRKEDDLYYQGPFWIIADSFRDIQLGKFSLLGEKYLSDYGGNYKETNLSKSARTHKKIWDSKYKSQYGNVEYTYYPRGRVAIYQGTAYIHINSKCNIPSIIDTIVKEYSIDKLTLEIDLNDTYQGSHYDFQLK